MARTSGAAAASRRLVLILTCGLVLAAAHAQDPASSADHPPGNVNELTLAGLRPGRSTIPMAEAKLGRRWRHPSGDEKDLYVWCDRRSHLKLQLETKPGGTIQVVTVERMPASAGDAAACDAALPSALARTGRGVALGDDSRRLEHTYGTPFFTGPSNWRGENVHLIVYNFSWAGADKPQILESSFDSAGRLVKMTLSAEYY